MMEKCTDAIVNWLISCDAIEEKDKELYNYAVYSLILSLSPLLLAIGFGLGMGCVCQNVLIVIPFMIIRKFSGGYHAKHSWSCLIWSCLLLLLCMILSFHVKCGWGIALATAGAAISLICFSPIDNENRVLSQEEHSCYKRMTTVLVTILISVDMLTFLCRLHTYSVCISIGIILSAGLQLPCILNNLLKRL